MRVGGGRRPRRRGLLCQQPSTIHTLEPDFSPVHQFAAGAIPGLAITQTFFAEGAATSHSAERNGIGYLSHHASSLVDQPINAITDVGLAPAASHHFVANPHAAI